MVVRAPARAPAMPLSVAPLEGKPLGCRIEGASSLAALSADDESFAVVAEAFLAHGVVVVPGCADLEPEHELALYRRLERLWDDGPLPSATEPRLVPKAGANLRGAHPAGLAEISLLGNGAIRDHYGLDGFLEPTPWWERASMQWHIGKCGLCAFF